MIVVELDRFSVKYENTLALARAYTAQGTEVKMWDSTKFALLDMLYELKPDKVFHHSEIVPRILSKISVEYPTTKIINTKLFGNRVIADAIAYAPKEPHDLFKCNEVCIIEYPEVERIDNFILKKRMSVQWRSQFRVYGMERMAGAKYCGWIPKEMHAIMFSSAQSVLAFSKYTAVNAFMCNKNVKLIENNQEYQFSLTDSEIAAISAERIIESL